MVTQDQTIPSHGRKVRVSISKEQILLRLCLIALGAPKQELFAAYGRRKLDDVGFVSIGAGLDFFSGSQVRAPQWMRTLALEWLWRTIKQPMRMIPRYAKCFAILPVELLHAMKLRSALATERPASEQ